MLHRKADRAQMCWGKTDLRSEITPSLHNDIIMSPAAPAISLNGTVPSVRVIGWEITVWLFLFIYFSVIALEQILPLTFAHIPRSTSPHQTLDLMYGALVNTRNELLPSCDARNASLGMAVCDSHTSTNSQHLISAFWVCTLYSSGLN